MVGGVQFYAYGSETKATLSQGHKEIARKTITAVGFAQLNQLNLTKEMQWKADPRTHACTSTSAGLVSIVPGVGIYLSPCQAPHRHQLQSLLQ